MSDDRGGTTTDLRPVRLARRAPGTHLHHLLQVPPPQFGRRCAVNPVAAGQAPQVLTDDELLDRVLTGLRDLP